MSQVQFNHPNYSITNGDKISRTVYSPITEQEFEEVNAEIARYVEEKIVTDYGFTEVRFPEDEENGSSILASQNWQNAEKLLLVIQNKPRSKIGVLSRSLCFEQGLSKGTWFSYIERACASGFGVLILRPNTNSVLSNERNAEELVKVPLIGSETPEIHTLCVWENIVPKAERANEIYLIGYGSGASLCKDIILTHVTDERARNRNNCDKQIKGFIAIEASKIIEKDDPPDIRDLIASMTINFECCPHAPKGFRLDYRKESLGCTSVSLGMPSGSTEIVNVAESVRMTLDYAFKLLAAASQATEDAGFVSPFCKEIAEEQGLDWNRAVIISNPRAEPGDSAKSSRNNTPTKTAPSPEGETRFQRFQRRFTAGAWSPTRSRARTVQQDSSGKSVSISVDTEATPKGEGGGGGRAMLPLFRRRHTVSATVPTTASQQLNDESADALTAAVNQKLQVADFDLLKVVGKGAFGKVLLVRKKTVPNENKFYAMKVLKKSMIIDKGLIEYTKTERSILLDVKHPFIVRLRYAFQSDDKLYLLTDYYSGGNLYCHLKRVNYFSETRARFYAAELLLALEHLHSQRIIYRDIKLENCLLDSKGHMALTDFGLSEQNIDPNSTVKTMCGTAEYHPPELFGRVKRFTQASDWWSFGIMLYEMMVGVTPFFDKNKIKLFWNIVNLEPTVPGVISTAAKTCILGLLTKDDSLRLGAKGAQEIKDTAFFSVINFDALYRKELTPPFKPDCDDIADTKYVPTVFLQADAQESVAATQPKKKSLMDSLFGTKPKVVKFDRFTYAGDDNASMASRPDEKEGNL